MKSHQILLNNRFTASTQTVTSGLVFDNDYYSYIITNGGGMVNEFNVRGYLNDERNLTITKDFFAYLTGSTTVVETLNILSSDKKLSNVFNDYYQNFIVSANTLSSTSVVAQNLTGTTAQTLIDYYRPWSGDSDVRQITMIPESIINTILNQRTINTLTETTAEESYYVPVDLNYNFGQIPRLVYEPCEPNITQTTQFLYPEYSAITSSYFSNSTSAETASTINTLIQCFVDLNLNIDEETHTMPDLLSVSFETDFYMADEGASVQVKLSLSQPSTKGFEEATIILNPFGATLNSDFIPADSYPVTIAWAVGEQDKFLNFSINSDYVEEVIEPFILQIVGAINLNLGNITTTTVYIKDKTVLNYISLNRITYPADNSGITHLVTDENNDIDFSVSIDHPAYGVESVVLQQVPFLNTINGQVGPAINSLNPSDYVLTEQITGQAPNIITLPYTINFTPGEVSRNFLLYVKDNFAINPDKIGYFQIDSAIFSKIDQSQRNLELTVKDDEGQYKYVHLNFGKIYSEFGNGSTNTIMRMIDPQTGIGGGYQNMYINQYSNYLIEYNKTIIFKDYSTTNVERVSFNQPYVKVKITNVGTAQAIINGITVNPGQSTTVIISGNDFTIPATTNSNRNNITNFYDDAVYKIELINNYDAIAIIAGSANVQATNISGFNPFKLMDVNNTSQATNKTILLGTFTLPGYNVASSDTTYAYHLKSKYLDINTARVEGTSGGVFGIGGTSTGLQCPPVSSFANSISYSEFYKVEIENISVFGIIFLNYNPNRMGGGIFGSQFSKYNGFDFVDYTQAINYDCARTASDYNGLHYYNLPFILEP